jgi:phage-related protein (TIGR01555 family)
MPPRKRPARPKRQRPQVLKPAGPDLAAVHALDAFTNPLARIGWAQPTVENGAQYPMTRFSFQYWTLQSMYRSSWVTGRIIDAYPDDMMKNGIDLVGLDPAQDEAMKDTLRKTQTFAKMLSGMKWGRLFGGAACLIVIDGHDEILEQPLNLEDIPINSYCGLIPFDRWSGVFPSGELVQDVRSTDFGLPVNYQITTQTNETFVVHHTRMLRFIGKDLPSWEKQVQMYWGISELERPIEEIKRWDNAVGSALGLLMRANIFTLRYDDLSKALSGVGMSTAALNNLLSMFQAMNWSLSNQGMLVLPNEGGLESHQYSFSGIDDVLKMFRGNLAGATEYPQSRIFGETQTGLGRTNDGDEGIYYDNVKQKQTREVSPQLDRLLPIIAMSTLGQVPDGMTHSWPPNWVPTGSERAQISKMMVEGVVEVLNAGVISPQRALIELRDQSTETGMFGSITDEEIDAASDEVTSPMDMMQQQPEGSPGGGGGGKVPAVAQD